MTEAKEEELSTSTSHVFTITIPKSSHIHSCKNLKMKTKFTILKIYSGLKRKESKLVNGINNRQVHL